MSQVAGTMRPGSTPGLGTEKTPQIADNQWFEESSFSFYSNMTETILCVYYILVHQYYSIVYFYLDKNIHFQFTSISTWIY